MPKNKNKENLIEQIETEVVRLFTAPEISYVVAQHVANEPAFLTRFGSGAHSLNVEFSIEEGELAGAKVVLKRKTLVPRSEDEAIDTDVVEETGPTDDG